MRICIYCASSVGTEQAFTRAAREVGRLLAGRGIGVVYGGGNVGLMGVVADAALDAGGEVIGVIPKALVDRELAHPGVSQMLVVESMHERKQRMHDLSDGFIALPGGYGTLEELLETLTWAQLGIHAKPIGLLDVGGFYTPLLQFLDQATRRELLRPQHRQMLLAATDPAALLDEMAAYRPPDVKKWITPAES